MAGNKNIKPLHETVNWKNLKHVIKETAAFINRKLNENLIDLNDFNLNKIVCYRCKGIDLQGKNVEVLGFEGRSCFVDDNLYEIFEVPHRGNKNEEELFLVFAKNKSFEGQWIVCFMHITHTVKENNKYYCKVKFIPLFDGAISYNSQSKHYSFNCEKRKWALNRGRMSTSRYFDKRGLRASTYGKTYAYYLNHNPNTNLSSVKIYKKSKKKGTY